MDPGAEADIQAYKYASDMNALTFVQPGEIQLSRMPLPRIEDEHDAIIRLHLAGICGSDLHPFHGREPVDAGCIFGHEAVGRVVEVGTAVTAVRVGDMVMCPFSLACGTCYFCGIGLSARCIHSKLLGWRGSGHGLHGAQAEFLLVKHAEGSLVPFQPQGQEQGQGQPKAQPQGQGKGQGQGGRQGDAALDGVQDSSSTQEHTHSTAIEHACITPEEGLLLGDIFTTGVYCAVNGGLCDPSGGVAATPTQVLARALQGVGIPPTGAEPTSVEPSTTGCGVRGQGGTTGAGASPTPTPTPTATPAHAHALPSSTGTAYQAHVPPVYVVIGCGPVGLCTIMAASELIRLQPVGDGKGRGSGTAGTGNGSGSGGVGGGASETTGSSNSSKEGRAVIYAVDSVPTRLAAAAALGAIPVPIPDAVSLITGASSSASSCASACGPAKGAACVMECVGSPSALALAYALVRPGGVISSVGVHTDPSLPFTPTQAYDKNITWRIGRCPARSLLPYASILLQRLKGRGVDVAGAVISHTLPLVQGVQGYAMFDARVPGCTKVVLECRPEREQSVKGTDQQQSSSK